MIVNIIVAVDPDGGFAKNGEIPWNIKDDLKHFYQLTKGSAVIMGRKTWESLGKPLKNRENYVVTSQVNVVDNDVIFVDSITTALNRISNGSSNVWIIGGQEIYNEVLKKRIWDKIYLTLLHKYFDCDRFFKVPNNAKILKQSEMMFDITSQIGYNYIEYTRIQEIHEEENYLNLLRRVINADKRKTRNSVTRSIFCPPPLEFDMSTGRLPALTSKRMWIKGAFLELQWFLSGSTNSKELEAKGVNIWKGNSSRNFLDSRGLHHFPEGEIGETYGFLFRNFGGEFSLDVKSRGIDQLADVIDKIKNNPTDRRIIINLFKPDAIKNCALPPCLYFYQFYCRDAIVRNNTIPFGTLDLSIKIRSSDVCLGLPWNFLTGAFMLLLIAKITGKTPGRLIVSLGDAHIYEPHVEIFQEQLSRKLQEFPRVEITKNLETIDDMLKLQWSDIKITGYSPHPSIQAEMIA